MRAVSPLVQGLASGVNPYSNDIFFNKYANRILCPFLGKPLLMINAPSSAPPSPFCIIDCISDGLKSLLFTDAALVTQNFRSLVCSAPTKSASSSERAPQRSEPQILPPLKVSSLRNVRTGLLYIAQLIPIK